MGRLDKSKKPIIYMDGNSLGLASKDVEKEMKAEFERWKNLTTRRSGIEKKAAEFQAKLIGAEVDEVILTGGASINVHALISTFYKPRGKRTKIIGDELNFSSDPLCARWPNTPEGQRTPRRTSSSSRVGTAGPSWRRT